MHRSYHDIISRIAEPPIWWQEGGIPRYDLFNPASSTGIYCVEVALAEIACQMTDVRFIVAMEGRGDRQIAKSIRDFSLCYGDPPNVPEASPYTTSVTLRVIQYWHRNHPEYVVEGTVSNYKGYTEWRRDTSLEIVFPF